MLDGPDPMPPGTTGTVVAIRHLETWAQMNVKWDNGRTLMLVVPPDEVQIISDAVET